MKGNQVDKKGDIIGYKKNTGLWNDDRFLDCCWNAYVFRRGMVVFSQNVKSKSVLMS